MAISQVSKGVYVISPNQVKKYKDTAAGEYTSVFTKERAEQWQMAQKQALLELELGTKQFAEEMKTYRDRLKSLDARQKELEGLKVRVAEGRLDAKDAAEIAAMREAGDRQKTEADFEAKKAEVITKSQGSTTETTGGGGGAGTVGAPVSSGAQSASATFEQTTRGQPLAAKMQAMARETGTGGTIPTTGAADRVNARGSIAERAIATRAAELERAGQSPADARITAEGEALTALSATDPVAAREVSDYLASKAATPTAAGAGAGTTRTTTRPADVTTKKRPGLKEVPPAKPVETPPKVEEDTALQASIDAQIAALATERAGIDRPTMAGFDYITRAREVAAGRFGPVSASPAYGQRNAIEALLRADPAMRSAIMESFSRAPTAPAQGVTGPSAPGVTGAPAATAPAVPTTVRGWASVGVVKPSTGDARADEATYQAAKEAWTKANAAAPTPPVTIPDTEEFYSPFTMAPGQSAESLLAEAVDVGARAATPGLPPGAKSALEQLADTKFKEAERRMAEEARIGAEIAASERPFEIPFEQRGGETVPFWRKPGGPADQRALDELLARRTAAETTPAAPVAATPPPAPAAPPQIRPEAAALMTPEERRKMEEELTALVAKRTTERAEEAAAAAGAAKKTMADIEAAGAIEVFKGPKTGPGQTKEGYLLNRLEGAYALAKKADKLSRLSSSGPGKVAYDLYVANKAKGIPFSRTYEEITLTFSGDMPAMEKAHEIALALDIKDRDTAPGGK